ncbi:cobalamin biosynthesis protein CbiX [Cryobacterium adonitolivorans]|uniref:Cobalamin biosynthesis protein CbiX n=1 Tax=Cryobacterium adonitolivorans TaxID=1259189 RepID=A0A4R8WBJ9_9MICO|nr:CbiX/SirB N-terminal domain-containing protein [Cryobacterium adonitolivorans]TFC03531.1 cobalamin biosynthesis protein CbiX [Cryobacterium adonitolivorans]
MTDAPVLLATSHGTSDPAGQRAVLALVDAVAAAAPHLAVRGGYVDVQSPDVPTCLRAIATGSGHADRAPADADGADRPVVIVPLLLSAGYHVRVDLAEAAAAAVQPVRVTGALGPDPRLARILADRLHEIGLEPNDTVVLAAAGSTDAGAVADCHTAGGQLAAVLGRAVTVGFISAARPRLADAVRAARAGAPGRVVVATYLLAPGYFAGLAENCGADAVSRPLLVDGQEPPRELVDVVIDLYSSIARLELALTGLPWSLSSRA